MLLARKGQEYRVQLPLKDLARLGKVLSDTDGHVDVSIEIGTDDEGIPNISGMVEGTLHINCQRCLEPMPLEIKTRFRLGLVYSEEQGETLPEHYDAMLVEDSEVSLLEIIEDELLLALPQVALHDEQECSSTEIIRSLAEAEASQEAQQADNPFAVLEQLKDKH
jgi:uncharacterized protein